MLLRLRIINPSISLRFRLNICTRGMPEKLVQGLIINILVGDLSWGGTHPAQFWSMVRYGFSEWFDMGWAWTPKLLLLTSLSPQCWILFGSYCSLIRFSTFNFAWAIDNHILFNTHILFKKGVGASNNGKLVNAYLVGEVEKQLRWVSTSLFGCTRPTPWADWSTQADPRLSVGG